MYNKGLQVRIISRGEKISIEVIEATQTTRADWIDDEQ
jgi:hypothetical protein